MARVLTVSDICKRALRLIGEFPITETAPGQEQMSEALLQFDLMMAYEAGINDLVFFVPPTMTIQIAGGTQEYDLDTAAVTVGATSGVQKPLSAVLDDGNGNITPLDMVTRNEFEQLANRLETGTPTRLYIDRLSSPAKMLVHPTPAVGVDNFIVRMVFQTYSADLTKDAGNQSLKIRQAWGLWAQFALAEIIGSGPVRKLPETEIARLMKKAGDMKNELLQSDNREAVSYPRQVSFNNGP